MYPQHIQADQNLMTEVIFEQMKIEHRDMACAPQRAQERARERSAIHAANILDLYAVY